MKTILIVALAVCITFIFWLLNKGLPTQDMQLQKDKELKLERNIQMLYLVNPFNLNYSSIYNYNDSLFRSLEDRVLSNPQIVLSIPEEACIPCIKTEFNNLENNLKYVRDNVVLLTQYSKRRDLKIWIEKENIELPVYNTSQLFEEHFEGNKQIALFILDSTLQPKHLFFPISFMPELTVKYYKFLTELLSLESEYETDSISKSKVKIKNSEHRFGKIKNGKTVSTKFEIQNISDIPLVIHKVETTCGCTVAEWDKIPIQENEFTSITVNFKADKVGFFTKKVFIFTNTKESPQILLISGNVISE